MRNYPNLLEDIKAAPKINLRKNNYLFKAFAVGERGTHLSNDLIVEVSNGLFQKIQSLKGKFDYIVSIEPGGNQWGLLMASRLNKPLNIIRETVGYGKEFKVRLEGAIYSRDLHFQGFKSGDKVVIIDDVISSGQTLKTIISTLRKIGTKPIAALGIIAKGQGYKKIEKSEGVPVQTLIQLDKDGDFPG